MKNTNYTLENKEIVNAKKYIAGNSTLFDLFVNGLIDDIELDKLQGKIDKLTGYSLKTFDQQDNITTISNGSTVIVYDSTDTIRSSYRC